jgi:hypothetical protein
VIGVLRRLLREVRAEEPGVDHSGGDAERGDLAVQRFHPALEAELRCGLGGHEVEAGGDAGRRGDREDVPRMLLDAGRLFLEEARDIVARADRAAVTARRVGDSETGRLRIGVGYCMDLVEVAVRVFTRRHPTVHVQLHTMSVHRSSMGFTQNGSMSDSSAHRLWTVH